jgi:hypothetical protein
MTRTVLAVLALLISTEAPAFAADETASFGGAWRTTLGIVNLKQDGTHVTGNYGNAGQFTLGGTVKENELTCEYREGPAKGDARFTLDESGRSFHGGFQVRGGPAGPWMAGGPTPMRPRRKWAISPGSG